MKWKRLAVKSRHLMEWVESEPFWLWCPAFADELVRREAFEGLEATPEVVGAEEVGEMTSELVMSVVREAFDGRVLYRAVHALDLAVGPGVFGLGCAVLDAERRAGVFEVRVCG